MEFVIVIALLIAIPVILFPAAFVWYINISGMWTMLKARRAREVRRKVVLA